MRSGNWDMRHTPAISRNVPAGILSGIFWVTRWNPSGGGQVTTMDGRTHDVGKWDLLIAHPPCTYLTVTGNRWFNVIRYGEAAQKRWDSRCHAIVFFLMFAFAECERIAIENPVGCMSRYFRKPDQITQPYDFGDPFEKKTCWWLKGLPKLQPTDVVTPPPRQVLSSGKTMPRWYSNCGGNRAKARSVTFPGIAKAMAEQWGGFCNERKDLE